MQFVQFENVTAHFECAILLAYLRLAILANNAIITLDLVPAHTGSDNVVEGLKGLVAEPLTGVAHRRARRFYCCRAESYTRYYGLSLAGEWADRRTIPIYTVSLATMGGIAGVAFAERLPELPEFAEDGRGATPTPTAGSTSGSATTSIRPAGSSRRRFGARVGADAPGRASSTSCGSCSNSPGLT